jgi:hypothetical protein
MTQHCRRRALAQLAQQVNATHSRQLEVHQGEIHRDDSQPPYAGCFFMLAPRSGLDTPPVNNVTR